MACFMGGRAFGFDSARLPFGVPPLPSSRTGEGAEGDGRRPTHPRTENFLEALAKELVDVGAIDLLGLQDDYRLKRLARGELVGGDDSFRRNEGVDGRRGHFASLDRLEGRLLSVNADDQNLVEAPCIFDRLDRT